MGLSGVRQQFSTAPITLLPCWESGGKAEEHTLHRLSAVDPRTSRIVSWAGPRRTSTARFSPKLPVPLIGIGPGSARCPCVTLAQKMGRILAGAMRGWGPVVQLSVGIICGPALAGAHVLSGPRPAELDGLDAMGVSTGRMVAVAVACPRARVHYSDLEDVHGFIVLTPMGRYAYQSELP